MRFSEYPKEIRRKMLFYQEQQGNKKDINVFENNINNDKRRKGFEWGGTPEGYDFWYRVIYKADIHLFYKTYPKRKLIKHI